MMSSIMALVLDLISERLNRLPVDPNASTVVSMFKLIDVSDSSFAGDNL